MILCNIVSFWAAIILHLSEYRQLNFISAGDTIIAIQEIGLAARKLAGQSGRRWTCRDVDFHYGLT